MPNFWERKDPPHWAYGFLICGAAQSSAYEFHATFPRTGGAPHISVYERGRRDRKVGGNMWLGAGGLTAPDRARFLRQSGMSAGELDDFILDIRNRHRMLNPVPAAPAPAPQPIDHSVASFPALPGQATPAPAPPIMIGRTAPILPAANDPLRRDFDDLPAVLQSVVLMSGVFDEPVPG